MFQLTKVAALAVAFLLAGCAQQEKVHLNERASDAAARSIDSLRASAKKSESDRLAAQEVDAPYLVGNSVPLSREANMPLNLRELLITANFTREAVPLESALKKLSIASGVMITMTADASLPAEMFLPKTGGGQSGNNTQSPTGAPLAVPLMPPLPLNGKSMVAPGMGQQTKGPSVVVRAGANGERRALWSILDELASQADLSWRVVSAGVEFYRLETKVFNLPAIPPTLGTEASLGKNAGNTTAFETVNKTKLDLKAQDGVKGVTNTIDALLTTGGKAVVSSESQTIVVTDTAAALERVSRYLENLNRNLTRRVRVVVDAYEITNRDNSDLGLNWNVIYATLNKAISMNSPIALAGTQAGNLSFVRRSGSMANSSVALTALSEIATVVNQRSFPFTVTSGKPYTVAMRKTFDYVNQVQLPAQSNAGTILSTVNTPPTVMQKEETVGTFLTVIPTAKPDGVIHVALYIDQTSNRPLMPFTVGGSNSGGVTVQQKTIDGTGFILEAPARSGVPLVLGGIEFDTGSVNERRLAPGAPMIVGGSNQKDAQKTRTVLVVTATSEEGV